MRAISWAYPPDMAPADAIRAARRFRRQGANTVLTEDNRYLLYDPPSGTPAPDFHFVPTPRSLATPATRIVADAMHDAGIRVIHHVTACYASRDFMEQHRDWTQRDVRDPAEPRYFADYGGVWLFCLNNPDFREAFATALLDFTRATGVDGWMIDETEFLPDWFSCGCDHCRALFRRDTGFDLPTDPQSPVWANFDDPIWRAWISWRMTCTAGFFADVRGATRSGIPGPNPDVMPRGCRRHMVRPILGRRRGGVVSPRQPRLLRSLCRRFRAIPRLAPLRRGTRNLFGMRPVHPQSAVGSFLPTFRPRGSLLLGTRRLAWSSLVGVQPRRALETTCPVACGIPIARLPLAGRTRISVSPCGAFHPCRPSLLQTQPRHGLTHGQCVLH